MDTHQYLRMDSCHPHHCKISIPYSQALRLRWISSEESHLQKWTNELKKHLLKRGYQEQQLNTEIHWALAISRENCSFQHLNQDKTAWIPLVVTYHPLLPVFKLITKRHLLTLHTSERLQEAFSLPLLIAFHSLRNLRDLLVRATQTAKTYESPGNCPCGAARCKTCPILMATDEFTSHKTGQVFKIKFAASCKSSNIVYLITCRRCGQKYVGETGQPLHDRINIHCFDITQRRTEESPVAEHFNSEGHTPADMTVVAIDQIYSHNSCLRKIQESRCIRILGTSHPFRMNLMVDSLWNLLDDYLWTPWNFTSLLKRGYREQQLTKATGYPKK